jgi:hypothetical protein
MLLVADPQFPVHFVGEVVEAGVAIIFIADHDNVIRHAVRNGR